MKNSSQPSAGRDASAGVILDLIRTGQMTSRATIARSTGLSPTTVAGRVDTLIANGYIREAGEGRSQGGRRPRALEIDPTSGVICAVDLGSHHATFALIDVSGTVLTDRILNMEISAGPDRILTWIHTIATGMVAQHAALDQPLRGYALGLPGPVDQSTHRLVSPSRMPGWNGVNAAELMEKVSGLLTVVDNDANLLALGEHVGLVERVNHLVYVKAGSSIGCGVIASGELYRGFRGVAGDISHVTVPGGPPVLCSCGRTGCLDAVAGGTAIVTNLQASGVEVADMTDVIALARDAHPLVTQMLREAGGRVGGVLATIMNFFNPQRLVLGGIMGEAEAFVAGVQSTIYTECLPMITDRLDIAVSQTKDLGGVLGGAKLVLDRLFDVDEINHRIRLLGN